MNGYYASTEFQYGSKNNRYCKVVVKRPDGTIVKGSRTLTSYTGNALKRVLRETEADIARGAWAGR